jgi:hypothetical protein
MSVLFKAPNKKQRNPKTGKRPGSQIAYAFVSFRLSAVLLSALNPVPAIGLGTV